MLATLAIRDFAIIDQLKVEFAPGLTVLTGETGAGKTILVQALHLLLGGRASADMIRTDHESAEVEAEYRLPEASRVALRLKQLDLDDAGRFHVRRVIYRSGRNRAYVNGRALPVARLSEITRGLVDISGQHEHVELTDEECHRDILDAFGGLTGLRNGVGEAVRQFVAREKELEALVAKSSQRAEREEYLQFAIKRIDEVDPKADEDEALKVERSRLKNAKQIVDRMHQALGLLYERDGSAVENMGKAGTHLLGLVPLDPGIRSLHERLELALRQVEDLARDLEYSLRGLDADPARLEEIEERMAALNGLMRTHGPDLQAVLEKRTAMAGELASLEDLGGKREELTEQRKAALDLAMQKAKALSARRGQVARRLAKRLEEELSGLAMPEARFEVAVDCPRSPDPGHLQEWGLDKVRFLLSANPGEDPRPLSRVASGGELSRVLLALKAVLSDIDPVPTYVFDEVDSGVGGAVAEVIGAKLAAVSSRHQVVCITHLPQIAAYASQHMVVTKRKAGRRTVSEVELLVEEKRVEEVARMVGGVKITDKARSHARELLGQARKSKRRL
jgi:DNA repair protein RecN (Recombination protein N)